MFISVVAPFIQASHYLLRLFIILEYMETIDNFSFEYYFYTNKCSDNTPELLTNFMTKRKGFHLHETYFNGQRLNHTTTPLQRGTYMARMRNHLKEKHGKLSSQYVLLLDSDVVFLPLTLFSLIRVLRHKSIAMVSPACIGWNLLQKYNCIHYYDLALVTATGLNPQCTGNTCPFVECSYCRKVRRSRNILLPRKLLLSFKVPYYNVHSAFGGLSLIRTNVYNKISWGPGLCEHHTFCSQAASHGAIVLVTAIRTISIPHKANASVWNRAQAYLNKFSGKFIDKPPLTLQGKNSKRKCVRKLRKIARKLVKSWMVTAQTLVAKSRDVHKTPSPSEHACDHGDQTSSQFPILDTSAAPTS